jgi:hypothetical protein
MRGNVNTPLSAEVCDSWYNSWNTTSTHLWISQGNRDVVHTSLGYLHFSWFKQEVENFLISYFTNILCYVAVMTFHFLRKAIAGIYIHQLTVIKKLKLIADKNCETVGVSCDMSTSTEVAMLTGVEVFFFTSMWPCILNIFKYNQQYATSHNGIYYYKCSTCFRLFLRPSSGTENCIHIVGYLYSSF